ncbi:hypothetical protein C8J57DRAFT_1257999 [Mycena rebaudengoi]|nr:hypothetical protein C8J57DRAFT_1257999 [Mycena rebaudengoi]
MSFIKIAAEQEWAADAWPETLRLSALLNIPEFPSPWVTVPRTLAGMLEWVYVRRSEHAPDYTREHLLVYREPPDESDNTLCPVGVRVQGFVARAILGPLGNWDGTRDGAVGAVQTLVLEGHGHDIPWVATMTAVRGIQDLVDLTLVGRGFSRPMPDRPPRPLEEQDLFATRRITARNRGARVSVLQEGDDLFGRCATVEGAWMVTRKLSSGRLVYDEEGLTSFEPYDARAISEGDFVDICIGFDIVAKLGTHRGEMQYHVRRTLQHVLLLRTAAEIEASRTEAIVRPPQVTVVEQGLTF